MTLRARTPAVAAVGAVAILLAFAACSDNDHGTPGEPSDDTGGLTVRAAPDTTSPRGASWRAPSLSIVRPASPGSPNLASVPPTFAIAIVGGDTTNEACGSNQFCAIQGQAAGGYVAVLCTSGPGTCTTGTYQWSIQTPPPHSSTTFTPDTTVTDQYARVSIQTIDSTPPEIYPVTFLPTPLNGTPTPTPPTVGGVVHVLCSFKHHTCPKIEIVDRGK